MTLTSNAMEWLSQNRHRAYPMSREEWRRVASPTSGLDGILLDALAFNNDASGGEGLRMLRVEVGASHTTVEMEYDGSPFSIELSGGEESGEGSYETVRGVVRGSEMRGTFMSLSFSSHAYILATIGEGRWELGCPVLKTRVISLTDGMGVDGIYTNGSSRVPGHENAALASGDVVLEDGFRTSPVIQNGKVRVRVGPKYGYDPCLYDYGEEGYVDCREPMFFFCGQNAVNNANVVLKGGPGISIEQGREYTIHDSSSHCTGKSIPCIEIIATRELLDMFGPKPEDEQASMRRK